MKNLIDPKPKATPRAHAPVKWPVTRTIQCPAIILPMSQEFGELFERRRSNRSMERANFRDVVNVVAFATAPRQIRSDSQFAISRRLSPSAGGLHSVELLLIRSSARPRVFRYDPWNHELQQLGAICERLRTFLDTVLEILPGAHGDVLIFAGDIHKIESIYDNPESLLWRDSGALLQTIYLVGTAFDMSVCALGISGVEAIEAIEGDNKLMACGVVLLGRASSIHRGEPASSR